MNKQLMQQTLEKMLQLAAREPAFDALCRRDPAKAYAQVAGGLLPEGSRFRVVEVQPGELLLPLPATGSSDGAALEDRELDAVAGGGGDARVHQNIFGLHPKNPKRGGGQQIGRPKYGPKG